MTFSRSAKTKSSQAASVFSRRQPPYFLFLPNGKIHPIELWQLHLAKTFLFHLPICLAD